ncbi:MoaD/ThiS family protein [Crateriforma conspicua]|uniref:ThiS family protein n=1 Tax=Crateriforma conspicua TaxID=2527996 RepID=A0A5C5Y4L4_9PLAN|nr:MoaD/ThiS family protein [Crateriforma conspicua]TWT70104.1 ThiS family protein [Crateriforma conspicua]
MTITVRFYAGIRQQCGLDQAEFVLPDGASATDLFSAVAQRWPDIAPLVSSSRLAVDDQYVNSDHRFTGDTVCDLIPPVSGG